MGYIGIALVVILISSAHCASDPLGDTPFCLYRSRGLVWDIDELQNHEDVYSVVDPNNRDRSVSFNICDQLTWDGQEAYAVLNTVAGCRLLTDDANNPTEHTIGHESLGLVFSYTGDKNCDADPSRSYSFELRLICDKDNTDFEWVENADNPCLISVTKDTPYGCPIIRANALWNFTYKYRVYITPAIILIGLFFVVVGGYFIKTSVFIIMLFTTIVAVLFVMYAIILPFSTPEWVGWVVLVASAIAGLVVGALLAKFLRIGVFFLGCWLGGTIATWLFELFVYRISPRPLVLWILIAVLAIIFGVISIKFLKLVAIIGTSFIGSFMIVRSVASYIGGYPNEFELFNDIQAGDIDNVRWPVYIYLAAMVILAVLGILFQIKRFKLFRRNKNGKEYQQMKTDD